MDHELADHEPTLQAIEAMRGLTLLEFGTDWCSHCQAAQGLIASVLKSYPGMVYLKITDGSGRPLGRHYRVKLWPTLVVLSQGREVARVIRPRMAAELDSALRSAGPAT